MAATSQSILLSLLLITSLTGLDLSGPLAPVNAAPAGRTSPKPLRKDPPKVPHGQRPANTRSGGSLNEGCSANKTLWALVSPNGPAATTRATPSIWVYSPYGSDEVQEAEFSVNVGLDEKQRLYRSRITLPQTPGFLRLSLPAQSQYELQEGVPYRWYFTLRCGKTQVAVDAGIERIAPSATAAWYDDIAIAAQQVQVNPKDAKARERWRQLLQQLHLTTLENKPLFSP